MRQLRIEKKNSLFQVLYALKTNRSKRSELNELFIEGTAGIKAAAQGKKRFRRFVFRDYNTLSDWARGLIEDRPEAQSISLKHALYEELSDKEEPSELIATVEKETLLIDEARLSEGPLVLVLDRPSNHGNLGAMVRSANAFGVELIIILGHGVDPFDPAVIRASRGSVFHTPICQEPSHASFVAWLARLRTGYPDTVVLGTDSRAERVLSGSSRFARPAVVLMGNESKGLSVRLREAVDEMVSIPMQGQVDSLNVACAASIILFELSNQAPTET